MPAVEHIVASEHRLPPPRNSDEAGNTAKAYISDALKRFRDEYGIIVKTGVELEFYALDRDGQSKGGLLDPKKVDAHLKREGIAERFEDENVIDYYGQYEAVVGIYDPLETAIRATRAREYLQSNAETLGVSGFDFRPLPFPEKEASSAHISLSLWTVDGQPLFADNNGVETPLMKQIAKGILEVQRNTVLLYAQSDQAYRRFGNTEWSPNVIGVSDVGSKGTTLRFATKDNCYFKAQTSDPKGVRIENRLSASDADYFVAMAATVAGIEFGLQQYVKAYNSNNVPLGMANNEVQTVMNIGEKTLVIDTLGVNNFSNGELPRSRYDALQSLKLGLKKTLNLLPAAKGVFEAVVRQHEPHNAGIDQQQDRTTPQTANGLVGAFAAAAAMIAVMFSPGSDNNRFDATTAYSPQNIAANTEYQIISRPVGNFPFRIAADGHNLTPNAGVG